jgi:tRNA (cmo5U34)-methyltransferase
MTVASHLGIQLADYDARIRTFIPDYDALLDAAADSLHALGMTPAHVVDLGTGTGALAERCLRAIPDARVTAIDEDAGMLEFARQRLAAEAHRATTLLGSFLEMAIPSGDAIVGSLTFHHLRTDDIKRDAYRRFRAALSPGGVLISADCNPSADDRLAARERAAWRAHLGLTYGDRETDALFAAWAREDVYVPLSRELELLGEAGFRPEVVWRRHAFAVIVARRG